MGSLTDKKVKSLAAGTYGDGAGLYIQVTPGGARSWLYRFKKGTKTTWAGLGGYPTVSLSEARIAAADAKRQVRAGLDPIEAKKEAKAAREEAAGRTFKVAAELYIAGQQPGWRNAKHGAQWTATLLRYAYPIIGEKHVSAVSVDHISAILEPIWAVKPETASRVRGRIESVLDYAKSKRWRTGENPARWKGHLDKMLPARAKVARVEHHAAVPWADLPAVMAKLAASSGTAAACLRFATLTAARSGEARGALWEELDMRAGTWTIPRERMKAGAMHRVPLSPAALAILRAAYPPGVTEQPAAGLVFPGGRALGSCPAPWCRSCG
jgi:integrase